MVISFLFTEGYPRSQEALISTSFRLYNVPRIWHASALMSLYITCRRYFSEKRYDTSIPILYGLGYYCPFWTSCAYICGLQTQLYFSTGVLLSKDIPSPCIAGGVIFTVTQK